MKMLVCLLFCASISAQSPYEKDRANARVEWASMEETYFISGQIKVRTSGKDHSKLIYFSPLQDWTSAAVDSYLTPKDIVKLRDLGFKTVLFVDEPKPDKKRVYAAFDLNPKNKK